MDMDTGGVDTGAITDATMLGSEGQTSAAQELYDLIEGKNQDGTDRVRQVSREDLLKFAQKGLGADNVFQESAKQRNEAAALKGKMAELARMMQTDPFEVLRAFGKNPDEYVSSYFERQLEEQMMDPRDRELAKLRGQLGRYEQEHKDREQAEFNSKVEVRAGEIKTAILGKIEQALQATGTPKNARTVAEIGKYLASLNDKPGPDGRPIDILAYPVERIIKHINSQRITEFSDIFGGMDDDAILANLDPALHERFARAMTKKLSAGGAGQSKPAPVRREDPTPVQKGQAAVDAGMEKIRKMQAEFERLHGKKTY